MRGSIFFALIVGALIFIPLEKLFVLHRRQKIFRRGWHTDLSHFLFTRIISKVCGFVGIGMLIACLHWLVSPAFRAANDTEACNKNFAGELPVLDWLFGTIHPPAGKMPVSYGTREFVPLGYLRQMLYPFLRRT